MTSIDKSQQQPIPLRRYAWCLAGMWTLAVALSLAWNILQEKDETLNIARHMAQTVLDRDILYRRWAAAHGGVYVPATPETPPTPYLAHLLERDLKTPSGRELTLLNPAYMTRQVYEFARSANQAAGHLTSLNPIRPENGPDPWEKSALQAFEDKQAEVHAIVQIAGQPHMRLMRPFVTEQSCQFCHSRQGYKLGDIRGGISVTVPMAPLLAGQWPSRISLMLGHVALWLLGIVGIALGTKKLEENAQARLRAQESKAEAARIRLINEELEKRVKERTVQLEEAVEELEGFSYSVSHDLRAPLRAINGFARILSEDHAGSMDADGLRLLEVISANVVKMGRLIDELLAFSHLGRHALKMADLDMGAMVAEIVAELKDANPGRVIDWRLSPLPQVTGDPTLIRQVWVNLLTNAVKFTRRQKVAVIDIGSIQEGGQTVFYVKDNGAGFNMEYVDKVFGVFQRLHGEDEFEGTGVGLALVKRIIERHSGRIWAESRIDNGATFYFTLPDTREAKINT